MSPTLSGRRVLIVEDEMLVALGLEEMLTELGCTVLGPAKDVRRALEMIQESVPDAVVLDLNLRGEKSYPVADKLVALGVPFVFSTAYTKDNLLSDYRDSPFLQKPFESSQLSSVLTRILPDSLGA